MINLNVVVTVLTYKVRSTSTPVYLHRRIAKCACSRTLRSAAVPLLDKRFMRTDFAKCAFRFSAPTVWNSLPQTVLISDSLSVFKSRLKTFLFNQTFTEHWSELPPAPLKLRPYGAIEIRLLLLLSSWYHISLITMPRPHKTEALKVKVHTLDIAPLRSESPPQKRSGMAHVLKGFHSFTCTPTRSSAIGMSHTCLCLPSYSWYSFTDSGRMEGWVDLGAK